MIRTLHCRRLSHYVQATHLRPQKERVVLFAQAQATHLRPEKERVVL
jgi:hypothetical protein